MSYVLPDVQSNPSNYFFQRTGEGGAAQTLSLNGNILSLSQDGGSVNISSAQSVALSTSKLTAQSYTSETNTTTFQGPLAAPSVVAENLLIDVGVPPFINVGDSLGSLSTAVGVLENKTTGLNYSDSTTTVTGTLALSSDLNMSGNNIRNCVDIDLKGTNPSVNFFNSSDAQKASVDYVESSDKVTVSGTNVSLDTTQPGYPRVVLDGGGVTARANDLPVNLYRFDSTGASVLSSVNLQNNGVTLAGTNTVVASVTDSGVTIGSDPAVGAKPTLTFQNTNSGNSAQVNYDGVAMNVAGDINDINVTVGSSASLTAGIGFTTTVPNETVVAVLPAGTLRINQSGLASGNDPILSLVNVEGQEAMLRKASAAGGGAMFINNDTDIRLDLNGTTTLKAMAGGVIEVGGHGAESTIKMNPGDAHNWAEINYNVIGPDVLAMNAFKTSMESPNASLRLNSDGAGNAELTTGGLMAVNTGGGWSHSTPNFTVDTNGSGYVEIGDVSYGNNHTRMIINDAAGTIGFGGDMLLTIAAGGSSGQFLNITINGVAYKIALLNP